MCFVFLLIAVADIPSTPDLAAGGLPSLVEKQSQTKPLELSP
jgi:hypothetical protein